MNLFSFNASFKCCCWFINFIRFYRDISKLGNLNLESTRNSFAFSMHRLPGIYLLGTTIIAFFSLKSANG